MQIVREEARVLTFGTFGPFTGFVPNKIFPSFSFSDVLSALKYTPKIFVLLFYKLP